MSWADRQEERRRAERAAVNLGGLCAHAGSEHDDCRDPSRCATWEGERLDIPPHETLEEALVAAGLIARPA